MNQTNSRFKKLLQILFLGFSVSWTVASSETIVTGGKTGTYYAVGSNLRDIVFPALDVRDSKGSWANVEDMSRTKGVSLAIVQSDV